uniref:Peptidase S1 domain-containing protein n=1 Tax=Anopheles gambiae TaxID=7165 RepID=A0A1S4H5H0_ANOGA
MKQEIGLVILCLFYSNVVSANGNEKATAEAAVLVKAENVTEAEAAAQSGRIINGFASDIANYPFAISVRRDGQFYCGGTVISASYALTAATPVYPYRNSVQRITLYGGSTSANSGGVLFKVLMIAVHLLFNPNDRVSDYNIAILTVPANAFGGRRNIAPIPLASAEVAIGTKCTVFGWGRTNANLPGPANALRSADMVISSGATCARAWGPLSVQLTSNMICAKGVRGADLCIGDYGNALVCRGKLNGIAFLASPGCDNTRDSVYMRITEYNIRRFIRSQTGV